jgi:hypothetical protein
MNPDYVYTSLTNGKWCKNVLVSDMRSLISLLREFWGRSIMVWEGISLDAATELVVSDRGNLNAHRYITDILEPLIVPFAALVGQDFIYMQDNGRPHFARVVSDYLRNIEISVMEWPARNPDRNSIEHLWDNTCFLISIPT